MWDDDNYWDDDDMECYERECLREDARLDRLYDEAWTNRISSDDDDDL